MIAFGCAITDREVFRACAEPGIERATEADSACFALPATGSIFESYNAIMDWAAAHDDLEALVLVHQDAEIVDTDVCDKLRQALSDPLVGVVGCVGAVGVRSIAWWEGSVALASFLHRYDDHGGGDLAAFSWAWSEAPPYARTGEVDSLDGFLLGLSPWAVRTLRFDTSLGLLHGYDFDFCLQVREAGCKVVTADFRAIHHHGLMPFSDPEDWIRAHVKVAEKWDGRHGVGSNVGTWAERARLAEAERDAARLQAHAMRLKQHVEMLEIERDLDVAMTSVSWRLTAPLRRWSRRLGRSRATVAPRPSHTMLAHGIEDRPARSHAHVGEAGRNGASSLPSLGRWTTRLQQRAKQRGRS